MAFKYTKAINAARQALAKPRDKNIAPTIEIYWGESGTGKTRKALDDNPDAYILTKPNGNNTVWWDNYTGQTCVIFDEFYGWVSYDFLLRVLDRYPLQVQVKGDFVQLTATKFVITSNKPWEEWYPNVQDKSALKRRIQEFGTVTHFAKMQERDVT